MRVTHLFVLALLLGLLAVGCQNDPNVAGPDDLVQIQPLAASQFTLPDGATLQSATFYIYVHVNNDEPIYVHRVTDSWDEMTVTWTSFDGAFDATVINSFAADAVGWKSVDITGLVQDWLDGTYPNYGILLDQQEFTTPRAVYRSREVTSTPPYLEICYTDGNGTVCEDLICIGDTYIWELNPDENNGAKQLLYTGWETSTDLEKQSLLIFDVEYEPVYDGCTNTIGYWKNWNGLGPQPDMVTQYLPIWLGNDGGQYSIAVETAEESFEILSMSMDSPKNGIIKLYAQLLGAKLSIANGADDSAVADVISDADDFLADHDYTAWYNLSKDDQRMVNGWMETLDDYNNGYIGPGHCDDEEYEDEEEDD